MFSCFYPKLGMDLNILVAKLFDVDHDDSKVSACEYILIYKELIRFPIWCDVVSIGLSCIFTFLMVAICVVCVINFKIWFWKNLQAAIYHFCRRFSNIWFKHVLCLRRTDISDKVHLSFAAQINTSFRVLWKRSIKQFACGFCKFQTGISNHHEMFGKQTSCIWNASAIGWIYKHMLTSTSIRLMVVRVLQYLSELLKNDWR